MNNYFEDEYYYDGIKMVDKSIIDFFILTGAKHFKYNVGNTVAVIDNGVFYICTIVCRQKYIDFVRETAKTRGIVIGTIGVFKENIKYVLDIIGSHGDVLLVDEESVIAPSENKSFKISFKNGERLDVKSFTVKDCSVEFTTEDPYISKRLNKLIENKPEKENNKMKTKYKIGDRVYCIFDNTIHPVEIYDIYTFNHTINYCVVDMYVNEQGEFYVKEKKYWKSHDTMDVPEFQIISKVDEPFMPDIVDYTYDPDTATTIITWSDNTTTKVTAENLDEADQYTGFMTAYAKKAAGNSSRIQSIYERALKLPEKKALAEQKAKEQEEEQRKIRENQKARKRRQRIRREARRRKEQYEKTLIMDEAKRLAEKEYGVPYEQDDWVKQNEGNAGNDKT